MLVASV
ncbi:hypothetical protein BsWGS_26858 [Bradybaena similaris]